MTDPKLLSPKDWEDYELIDCGDFQKLERFGELITARPEPQALWERTLTESQWNEMANATFIKRKGNSPGIALDEKGEWVCKSEIQDRWFIKYSYRDMNIKMRLGLTSFKHVGIFPEQAENWKFIYNSVRRLKEISDEPVRLLNLFAYTGGASLAACSAGAEVTHVDSVKQVINWGRENMQASGLDGIRWIVDDALKFARREVKRGNKYDGIILDPPAYGRGPDGEKWILEQNLPELLQLCSMIMKPRNSFFVLNLYSMGLSSLLARTAVTEVFEKRQECKYDEQFGELYFQDRSGKSLPLGVYYRFFRSTDFGKN